MRKFSCGCGRQVRDVFYKNGQYTCAKCFWQETETPHDYIINLLASRGLVITFHNEPVLVLKQFSADLLDEQDAVVTPDASWLTISGDDFWLNFTGRTEQLRNYLTTYTLKSSEACGDKEEG